MRREVVRFLFTLVAVLLLAGCAAPTTQRVSVTNKQTADEARKQLEIFAEDYVGELKRARKVHWELATKAVALCPRKAANLGAEFSTKPKGDLGVAMQHLYGVGDEPTVLFLLDGGPAQVAGLRARDRLVSVHGIPVKDTKAIAQKLRAAPLDAPVPVVVRRGSQTLTYAVNAVAACDYPITLDQQQVVNAFADGERIVVTRGMMAFARSDEELALVIGHEMAHNTMAHMDAKRQNAAGGLVADIALAILTRGAYRQSAISNAAAQAYSQEFEAEADYVGLYMLARTGYVIDDAPKFWRRMAAANPASIKGTHSASHPSTSYRMVALEAAVKEIDGKRATGVALLPEKKDGKEVVPGTPATAQQGTPGTTCFVGPDGKCSR
jgi:membrane-associated protease RseP (regulator of RpoE activity)